MLGMIPGLGSRRDMASSCPSFCSKCCVIFIKFFHLTVEVKNGNLLHRSEDGRALRGHDAV